MLRRYILVAKHTLGYSINCLGGNLKDVQNYLLKDWFLCVNTVVICVLAEVIK